MERLAEGAVDRNSEVSINGKVEVDHSGVLIHYDVARASRDVVKRYMHQVTAHVARSEAQNDLSTFDEWLDRLKGVARDQIALGLTSALTSGYITERKESDGRYVLIVNSESPFLASIVSERPRSEFVTELWKRLSASYKMR